MGLEHSKSRLDTGELDLEIQRNKAQLLHLADSAQRIGHLKDALRLLRAYRYLNGDTDIQDSEMKGQAQTINFV